MHTDHEEPFLLWDVSAFDPKSGKIVLAAMQVTARTSQSAHNKAVAEVAKAFLADPPADTELNDVLDQIEVKVSPF